MNVATMIRLQLKIDAHSTDTGVRLERLGRISGTKRPGETSMMGLLLHRLGVFVYGFLS